MKRILRSESALATSSASVLAGLRWTDITDRLTDKSAGADLIVYGGGIRLAHNAVKRLRSDGIMPRSEGCCATAFFNRAAGLLALSFLPRDSACDVGVITGYRDSYATQNCSIKFTSMAIANEIRAGGGKCSFALIEGPRRKQQALFKMFHQEYAEDTHRRRLRRPPRTITAAGVTLTEVLG